MSVPRIAINGFGRIGRTITRIAKLRRHFDLVAVNDVAPPEALLYAFRFDSIHGRYPGRVELSNGTMNIDGDPFLILSEKDPAKLPWKDLKVDYVVESTGAFRKLAQLSFTGEHPILTHGRSSGDRTAGARNLACQCDRAPSAREPP